MDSHHTYKAGWLYKWTNYIKGYQKRYFVLDNGILKYYKNENETDQCRGDINLISAVINTSHNINIIINKGGSETFHLRAENEFEKQKWVNAIEAAKRTAIKEQEDEEFNSSYDNYNDLSKNEYFYDFLNPLLDNLNNVKACTKKVNKCSSFLQNILSEIERDPSKLNSLQIIKLTNEKIGAFKIAIDSTIKSCNQYNNLAEKNFHSWYKKFQNEHEKRLKLEEMVEQIAKQHSHLEKKAKLQVSKHSSHSNEDDDEFYDAEESATDFFNSIPGKAQRVLNKTDNLKDKNEFKHFSQENIQDDLSKKDNAQFAPFSNDFNSSEHDEDESSTSSENDENSKIDQLIASSVLKITDSETKLNEYNNESNNLNQSISECNIKSNTSSASLLNSLNQSNSSNKSVKKIRRKTIPARPNQSLNLWSFMKNCIGKELTKIPMPVNFNEPLSMLQRITEDFEYADLIHKAAKIRDPCEQLTYIAAFCVSHYATTSYRTCKPFNPLLGETFECDRMDDLGWKSIAEQVSHHPPMLALHCEAKNWSFESEFAISSKFRGKYLQINPIDSNHLIFPELNYHLTWRKVTTTVHNIIVGKIWVDNHGEMVITNHTTQDKCHLKFSPYSYFSRELPRKVTGVVLDKNNTPKWLIKGNWDQKIEVSQVLDTTTSPKGCSRLERGISKVLWKKTEHPQNESMYNLTKLAIELNEPEEGVAPTDSRLRPDQRLMEKGSWDEANRVKMLLEQKQRNTRRLKEEAAEKDLDVASEYEPLWFKKTVDDITGQSIFRFNDEYWKVKKNQDWSKCPDIFTY